MKRGEIYFVSLDPTVGREQQGIRPILIVSPENFNNVNRMPLVVPITSGGAFARNAGFAVSLSAAGTRTTGFVLCNQLRSLDIVARGGRRVEAIPPQVQEEVLARLRTLLE